MHRSPSRSGLSTGEPSSPRSGSRRSRTPVLSPSQVITSPPWARDETPSPTEEEPAPRSSNVRPGEPSGSSVANLNPSWDTASTDSNATDHPGSRWWVFTRPRRQQSSEAGAVPMTDIADGTPTSDARPDAKGKSPEEGRRPMRERLKSSVLLAADYAYVGRNRRRHTITESENEHEHERTDEESPIAARDEIAEDVEPNTPTASSTLATSSTRTKPVGLGNSLRLELPQTPMDAFTLAQNQTPGWQSPWAPHPAQTRAPNMHELSSPVEPDRAYYASSQTDSEDHLSPWQRRHKAFRRFVLHNSATPLILRIINLALTTSTLGTAIAERRLELHHHVLGVVGSSITLNIIFAPLTITHVLVAIYLEYFGRPLGLWHTSWKLFHTLSETVFICLWSAALSLTFDNYFTSGLRCAPLSSTRWWDQLPSPPNPLGGVNVEGSLSDNLCDHTLALIVLIFFGLITYILSLGVSLFRIFEKVKYSGANQSRSHI